VVLLVWTLCCLTFAVYLYRFSVPCPNFDEWDLTPVATGEARLTWKWLWLPANQHRAPLARLEVVLLGWATAWDFRLAHYVNLAWLGLGSLALLLAARTVRGQSSLADAFLALLVLTPGQFESVLIYAYGYAMALAWLGVAVSAAATGWPLRSLPRLALYFVLVLGVTLAGGPAGNFWAIGLCAVVLRGWLERQARAWLVAGALGTVVVGAVSAAMLLTIPHVPNHEVLKSDSVATLLEAAARLTVCWMGYPILEETWPWPAVALALLTLYCLGRILTDLWRLWRGGAVVRNNLAALMELAVIFLAAMGVTLMIGYARGKCPIVWDSRYCTLLAPVGILLYLLLVRLRAPLIFAVAMAFWLAVCVGWNWSWALSFARYWHAPIEELVAALREGEVPLSALSARYARAVGCEPPGRLLHHLVKLHNTGQSVFHPKHLSGPTPGGGPSLVWEAVTGRFNGELELVPDDQATGGRTLRVAATATRPGTATYTIDVPATGAYLLCCRLAAPAPGHVWQVRVDEGPALERPLPAAPGYYPSCLDPLLDLGAGRHTLIVTLPTPGIRLDLLELIPRSLGVSALAGARAPGGNRDFADR
jgi:hypothetical protein